MDGLVKVTYQSELPALEVVIANPRATLPLGG